MHRERDMASNRPANFSTTALQHVVSRRSALRQLGLAGVAFSAAPAFAEDMKVNEPRVNRRGPSLGCFSQLVSKRGADQSNRFDGLHTPRCP
jgi:hypothetical protein